MSLDLWLNHILRSLPWSFQLLTVLTYLFRKIEQFLGYSVACGRFSACCSVCSNVNDQGWEDTWINSLATHRSQSGTEGRCQCLIKINAQKKKHCCLRLLYTKNEGLWNSSWCLEEAASFFSLLCLCRTFLRSNYSCQPGIHYHRRKENWMGESQSTFM